MNQHAELECTCANPGAISMESLPQHEKDTMCRILTKMIKQAFQDPEIAADFERWKAERSERLSMAEK